MSDGVVTLRAMREGDAAILIAGRDGELHRWMGEGAAEPRPTAVIEVGGEIVGWVDHDHDDTHTWLEPHECNVGYSVFAAHRGRGHATRAVRLLLDALAGDETYRVATFLIDEENVPSRRVAAAVGAVERAHLTSTNDRPQVLLERALER